MELKTERLVLRPLCGRDLDTYTAYAMDAETCRYMLFLPHRTAEDAQAFLHECEENWQQEPVADYEMAIALDGRHIGGVSMFLEGDKATLGWILNKAYQGKGYAYEAASALMGYAVNVLEYRRIVAHCDARNERSQRLMEKLGMQRVREQTRTYPDERGTAVEYKYEWRR